MKAVIQRVKDASVTVEGNVVGSLGSGLIIFFCVEVGDCIEMVEPFLDKILRLRIFVDEEGKMNKALADVGGGVMIISQFTLSGNIYKGNRPSFDASAPRCLAVSCYEKAIAVLEEKGIETSHGVFGAHMDVRYLNDGPVTFFIDSDKMHLKR